MKTAHAIAVWFVFCIATLVATAGLACSSDNNRNLPGDNTGQPDAAIDSPDDIAPDVSSDSFIDAELDATQDVSADVPKDAVQDVSSDSPDDAANDALTDAFVSNAWPKGKVGKVVQVTNLAKHTGAISMVIQPKQMHVMDLTDDAGDGDAADEAGVDTAPVVNANLVDFEKWWMAIPPYYDPDNGLITPASIFALDSNGTGHMLHPFTAEETQTEFSLQADSWSIMPIDINGTTLHKYVGLSMDIVYCFDAHYLVTNGSDKIWRIADDGTKTVLTSGLTGPSTLLCHPQNYLLVSTTPTFEWVCPPEDGGGGCYYGNILTPSEVYKVELITGTTTLYATLPLTVNFPLGQIFKMRVGYLPDVGFPVGWRVPMARKADNSLLVGDQTSKTLYMVSPDADVVDVVSGMDALTATAILAPNEVIYTVSTVVLNEGAGLMIKPKIKALHESYWYDILDIEGYETVTDFSSLIMGIPCGLNPNDGICRLPLGIYPKIDLDSNNNLIVADPMLGEINLYHLDFLDGPDAGEPDAEEIDAEVDAEDEPADDADPDADPD
ncbi:MAG: hypothetical protein PHS79_04785 [Patescibacteria group bacterium]|nr:hypothetical protein [Patescibacteria group bacterium]